MTYHIPRVMRWTQAETTFQQKAFGTHDFMPPFPEYLLLHLYHLAGSDRILFLSQWMAYIVMVVLSGRVVFQLGGSKKASDFAKLLVSTIPIVVLQASSTQTDLLSAVLLLIELHLVLLLIAKPSIKHSIYLGMTLGLGLQVKTTFAIFAIIPLGLFLIILRKNFKK
jgi:4-amino-4-deoxy-L-arabinose transferase-like glycosyltransferase